MSGFEIAGITLAIIPLAIEAIKAYRDYFPRSKKVQEDLKQLVQSLESEELRITNISHRLIVHVSLPDENTTVRELLKNACSPKWREMGPEIESQLRTLLGSNYNKFHENLDEVGKSIEKLRVKLKLPDPRVDPTYNQVKEFPPLDFTIECL